FRMKDEIKEIEFTQTRKNGVQHNKFSCHHDPATHKIIGQHDKAEKSDTDDSSEKLKCSFIVRKPRPKGSGSQKFFDGESNDVILMKINKISTAKNDADIKTKETKLNIPHTVHCDPDLFVFDEEPSDSMVFKEISKEPGNFYCSDSNYHLHYRMKKTDDWSVVDGNGVTCDSTEHAFVINGLELP
ncbi:hypothetical protein PMAYCL1PPCAC_14008, partial [Pristionchus mayeri]